MNRPFTLNKVNSQYERKDFFINFIRAFSDLG